MQVKGPQFPKPTETSAQPNKSKTKKESELSFREWAHKLPLATGNANVQIGDRTFSYVVEKDQDINFERRSRIIPPDKDKK